MSQFQVNLPEFHSDILDYITQNSRIMSCLKLEAWNEFTIVNNFIYIQYSREDLRNEFIETILPRVLTYDLTEVQQRKIEIFATHNGFVSTQYGFKIRTSIDPLATEGVHFSTSEDDVQEHSLSCIIDEFVPLPTPDQKIKAFVSAVNSTDDELAFNRLLPTEEIVSRLSESKKEYKISGNFPLNLSSTIGKKITRYRKASRRLSSRIVPK